MLNTQKKIWSATLYLRLSRDDGDKEESGSITGSANCSVTTYHSIPSFGSMR